MFNTSRALDSILKSLKELIFDPLNSDETGLPTAYSDPEITVKCDMILGIS